MENVRHPEWVLIFRDNGLDPIEFKTSVRDAILGQLAAPIIASLER